MIDQLVIDLLKARDDAARRELWRTMHAIADALQHLGWELAERQSSDPKRMRKMADEYMETRNA